MKAASILAIFACLLAGCSGGQPGSDVEPPSETLSSSGAGNNGTPEVRAPPPLELHNRTYTLQPTSSPAADSATVPRGYDNLTVTAEVVATSFCFYTNTEPGVEFVEPGVYVTSPQGTETLLAYETPSSCDPVGTFPRRLDLKSVTIPAEEGSWSLQIRTTGQNVDVRLVVRVGSPPVT